MAYGPQGQILGAGEAQGKDTNSIMSGWVDRGPWQYWDTLTGNANTAVQSQYSMFQVPQQAQNPLPPGGTKSKLYTNMTQAGSFAPPRCLLLFSIGFYFSSRMVKPDIDAILDGCWVEFIIDEKKFHEGQMWQFPGGAGLAGVSTQTGESAYTNGLASPFFTRRYDEWSKYIAPLQQFALNIFFPGTPPTMSANGVGMYIPITLDGLTDRSVQ